MLQNAGRRMILLQFLQSFFNSQPLLSRAKAMKGLAAALHK